jgi:HK97 family phage portal protein
MKIFSKIGSILSGFWSTKIRADNGTWFPMSAFGGGSNVAGVRVTEDTAMTLTAVYGCIKILSETVGALPLHVYRRTEDGGKERLTDHWLPRLLEVSPNDEQTPFEFWEFMEAWAAARGNSYAEIIWNNRSEVEQLIPIDNAFVKPERLTNGMIRYTVMDPRNGGRERFIAEDDMFHLRGLSRDGFMGISPIAAAARSVGISIATEEFGAAFYENGGTVGNVYEHPNKMSPEAYNRFKKSIEENHNSPQKAHKAIILEEGAKQSHQSVTPEEAQFLATRKFGVSEVARLFKMPPHMLGDLERALFNNIEQMAIDFVTYTLTPWLVRIEDKITQKLLLDDTEIFAEFQTAGLLRGDIKTRFQSYAKAIQFGWMNRNEVRKLENLNTDDDELDKYLVPMNMRTTDEPSPLEVKTKSSAGVDSDTGTAGDNSAFIDDIAERITASEEAALKRHGGQLGDWEDKYKAKHHGHLCKILYPVAKSMGMGDHSEFIASELADTLTETLWAPPTGLQGTEDIDEHAVRVEMIKMAIEDCC